ncbi:MAG: hypothetical protein H3C30_02595 [Candidatus Hydrogenedentes bacterium]|nr:hypothetical protein [Candidatus Hydrogenedentota bacterium]
MRRVLLAGVCCLGALAAWAAPGDENWGQPVRLLPPDFDVEIGGFFGPGSDMRPDGTGRLWVLHKQTQYRHDQLATWEGGQWRVLDIIPERTTTARLDEGPDGTVTCSWEGAMIQLKGLRMRVASGVASPGDLAQIYRDASGSLWGGILPPGAGRVAFPESEGLETLLSIRLKDAPPAVSDKAHRVLRDNRGRYWFSFNGHDFPYLVGVFPEDEPPAQRPDCRNLKDTEFPQINMMLIGPSGAVRVFPGKPERHPSPGMQLPPVLGRLFWDSPESFLFSDNGLALWRVHTDTLCAQALYPKDTDYDYQYDQRMIMNGVAVTGDRRLLATGWGLLALEKDGAWTELLAAEDLRLYPGGNGWWAVSHAESNPNEPVLAFVPGDGGDPAVIRHPCGLKVAQIDLSWQEPDGGMALLDKDRACVQTLSPEDLGGLLERGRSGAGTRCAARVFAAQAPLIAPDGQAYVLNRHLRRGAYLHRWDGSDWETVTIDTIPPSINYSALPNHRYLPPGMTYALLAGDGRIWACNEVDRPAFAVDVETKEVVRFPSFLEALKNPETRPKTFVAGSRKSRMPLFCRDGRVIVTGVDTLYCLKRDRWRTFTGSELEIRRFDESVDVYVDEEDRVCVLSGEVFQVMASGEDFFTRTSPPAGAVAKAAKPPAKPAHNRPPTLRMINQRVREGVHGYLDVSNSVIEDRLGMTWSVRDGALKCSAFGLETEVYPAEERSPFLTWHLFTDIRRSSRGGVFLATGYSILVFVPTAPSTLETVAEAAVLGDGSVALNFTTAGEGLRHAWRVDRGPWTATDQGAAVAGPLPPGRHVVEVYAFDAQLNADVTPLSLTVGESAAPESLEAAPKRAPHGGILGVRGFDAVNTPLVAPDRGVFMLARNAARDVSLHRWDGRDWAEMPVGGEPPEPPAPRPDLYLPDSVDPDQFALADDGKLWVYEGHFDQRGQVVDFDKGEKRHFASLRARLEDPATRPSGFTNPAGRHTAPLVCADGRVVLRQGTRLYCLEGGAWRGHNLSALDPRPLFPREPFPLHTDGHGRLFVEKGGVGYVLKPGAAEFVPLIPPQKEKLVARIDIDGLSGASRPIPRKKTEEEPPPPPGPCLDALGMEWRLGEEGVVCAAHGDELLAAGREGLPFNILAMPDVVVRGPRGGLFVRTTGGALVFLAQKGPLPETRAKVAPQPDATARLSLATERVAVRHAWRVDTGPWKATHEREVSVGPLAPGMHVVEVYAFSDLLDADPTPERLFLDIQIQHDAALLLDALAKGDKARRDWAMDRLRAMGPDALKAVDVRLAETADADVKWVLEAARQQLERTLDRGDAAIEK